MLSEDARAPRFELTNATRLSRWTKRQVLACFGGGLALYVALTVALSFGAPAAAVPLGTTFFYVYLAAAAAISVGKTRAPVARAAPGNSRVLLEGDRLLVDSEFVGHRSDFETATVLPGKKGALVQLRRAGTTQGEVNLGVSSVEQGKALVRALGLDAGHALARDKLVMPSRGLAILAYLVSSLGATASVQFMKNGPAWLGASAMILTVVVAYAALAAIFIPSRVTVGTDGILVEWMRVYRKFVPMRDIASVGLDARNRIVLVMKSGQRELLSQGRRWFPPGPKPQTLALKARIEEALAASRAGEGGVDAGTALEESRRGKTGKDVIAGLRSLLLREGGFRTQAIVPEALWRIVENPKVDAPSRAAAAVALGPELDGPGRERLRVAAQTTAEPKLRIALETAEGEDEAQMAEALEALEAEEARQARA